MLCCPYSYTNKEALEKLFAEPRLNLWYEEQLRTISGQCDIYNREIVEPSGSDESSENEY